MMNWNMLLLVRISNESPVGKAILGKRKGDEVEVSTPDGPVTFKVLAIQ